MEFLSKCNKILYHKIQKNSLSNVLLNNIFCVMDANRWVSGGGNLVSKDIIQQCVPGRGGGLGDRGPQTDKHLPPSSFIGLFFKKSRHLGFGVFLDIWSMTQTLHQVSVEPVQMS
jgi:hypothetical protein